MIAGLSLPLAAQGVGERGMSGTEPRSTMESREMTPMARTTATELESDRDFDLGWLGLLGLAGLAGLRRRRHVHHTDAVGTSGTHMHDHSRTDRI